METIEFGKHLSSSLEGADYLNSPQKHQLDRFGYRVLSPLTRPLLLLLRAAVYEEDGSPTIIGLPRVGKDGKTFMQQKIRTMRKGNELVEPLYQLKEREDDRITKIGRHIRRLSLDELPQIQNIANGEMSLVGPRPKPIPEFEMLRVLDSTFEDAYVQQLPGITGLEQINGRASLPPEENVEFIKEYAYSACLALDLHILRKTLRAVRSGRGAF